MSGPTNEPIEVQRQEAYLNGLLEAKDMAYRRWVDSGKVNTTAHELHDSLHFACRRAEDVLTNLRATYGVNPSHGSLAGQRQEGGNQPSERSDG